MVASTTKQACLRMLTAAAMTIIVAGFGSISSSSVKQLNRIAAPMRQGLCLHEGKDDFIEQGGDQGSMSQGSTKTIEDERDVSVVSSDSFQASSMESSSSSSPTNNDDDDSDRAGALRKLVESFGDFGKPDATMPVGSTVVVSGLSLPTLGVYDWQSYELVEVYDQGVDESGMPVKVARKDLNEAKPLPYGYKRYVKLYSDRYHKETGPVIVSPDEITLVSVKDEVLDSLLMALPVFGFWTALAFSFANLYNDRYGGNFFDALFRT